MLGNSPTSLLDTCAANHAKITPPPLHIYLNNPTTIEINANTLFYYIGALCRCVFFPDLEAQASSNLNALICGHSHTRAQMSGNSHIIELILMQSCESGLTLVHSCERCLIHSKHKVDARKLTFREHCRKIKVVPGGYHRYFLGVKVKTVKLIDDLKAAIYACPKSSQKFTWSPKPLSYYVPQSDSQTYNTAPLETIKSILKHCIYIGEF